AYNDALGRLNPTPVPTVAVGDIGGEILYPGLYSASSIGITGPVTLDGQNASNPVFIFQISSTLITGTSSSVTLINGATAPNVIWQVGSSATLGTSSSLAGIILAKSAITFNTGATLEGRALAETAAVVFDGLNFITNP
ncbi:MAG TPA: ice-binding family protein, partial [bacterium]